MRLRVLVVLGAFFAVVVGVPFLVLLTRHPHGELADKRGWSVLQGMDDPGSQSSGAVLRRSDEFAVLGFLGVGEPTAKLAGAQPRWSWVLLNEHDAGGEVKQMPKFGSFDLSCSALREVERTVHDADVYAVNYLRSICT